MVVLLESVDALKAEIEQLREELAALKSEIEQAPMVYGVQEDPDGRPTGGWWKWDELQEPSTHTHMARLVRIVAIEEEIKT